jgi:hypothetical protein
MVISQLARICNPCQYIDCREMIVAEPEDFLFSSAENYFNFMKMGKLLLNYNSILHGSWRHGLQLFS